MPTRKRLCCSLIVILLVTSLIGASTPVTASTGAALNTARPAQAEQTKTGRSKHEQPNREQTDAEKTKAEAAEQKGPAQLKGLKYRLLGPAWGGRVDRACGVAGDPGVYYAAGAGSGVWKSTDSGLTWKPIFDDQPISSVGSIAVAPSDPNVI